MFSIGKAGAAPAHDRCRAGGRQRRRLRDHDRIRCRSRRSVRRHRAGDRRARVPLAPVGRWISRRRRRRRRSGKRPPRRSLPARASRSWSPSSRGSSSGLAGSSCRGKRPSEARSSTRSTSTVVPGGARDALRPHLGPACPRVARSSAGVLLARLQARGAAGGAPGDALGRRARALAGLRQPSAARRADRTARAFSAFHQRWRATRTPRTQPPSCFPRTSAPRHRHERLDRRPRDAPVRAPKGDASARAARSQPPARSSARRASR